MWLTLLVATLGKLRSIWENVQKEMEFGDVAG